jgi:phage-related protein (TIGR01555 family)
MVLDITSTLSQDVISIDGLNEVLADKTGKGTELIHERLNIVNSIKSIMSTLAIDGNDSYTNVNRSLVGTDKVLQFMQMMVSSASRIPITKLFGKSADGLNATGKGDLGNYYDDVWSNIVIGKIAPIYSVLDPIVAKNLFDSDDIIEYEFIPLYTLNEIEIADIEKKEADTMKVYVDAEIITPDEALKELQGKGKFIDIEVGDEYGN